MPPLPPPNTAPRFSEAAFRRYEPAIATIIENWPTPTVFDPTPTGLSFETVTCRLRDAMTGFARHPYKSELVDRTAFLNAFDELVVSQQNGMLVIGPRSAVRHTTSVTPIHVTSPKHANDTYTLFNPHADIFNAFCLLLSHRLLSKPLLVKCLDPQLLLSAQERFDIEASAQPDGSTLII